MQKFDIIIIGSGLGGLLCGLILSREGYQVCILEKHHETGGCMQAFERRGTRFDTGVHYIGGLDINQPLWRFFKFFGLTEKISISKLDPTCFDKINLGDKEYAFANGDEAFVETLGREFPGELNKLKAYVSKLKEIDDYSNLYNLRGSFLNNLHSSPYTRTSVSKFISTYIKNETLKNVLSASNMIYAGEPERSPAYLHATINYHYIESAWRMKMGGREIVDILSQSILEHGGTIIKNAKVSKLISSGLGKRIQYAELENGERIEGQQFISNTHPAVTINMLEQKLFRKATFNRINELEDTISCFSVYLIFKKQSFPYFNNNFYIFENENVWITRYQEKEWPQGCFFYTQYNTESREFAESAILITCMKYEDVKKWENTILGARPEDYKSFKKEKAEKLLNLAEKRFPGLKAATETYYTSSPLTYRDYTGTRHGSMYGIMKDSANPESTFLYPKTKIPNLFFTGQNINSHGILGVTISALLTCTEFLGFEYLKEKIINACK